MYDTFSSFSNTSGGIIIFGVDEKNNYDICEITNPDIFQKKITEQSLMMEPQIRLRTGISRSEDFKVQNMFIEGGFNAVSGALSVLGGYLGGMAGVHNKVFTKLLSQKGDLWLRLLVGNVFTAGFKLTNALIKPYFMI